MADQEEELLRKVRAGKCVAFIGSGPSIPQYPKWSDLVRQLCEVCDIPGPADEDLEDEDTLLNIAETCRGNNPAAYLNRLQHIFGQEVLVVPRVYYQLASLPFQSYVTTNFDPLLRITLAGKCSGVYIYPDLPYAAIGTCALYHVHGLIAQDFAANLDRIVLGQDDFRRGYSEADSTLRSFLHQLLIYHSCCFIGIQLREPEFRSLAGMCVNVRRVIERDYPGMKAPEHYALLPMVFRRGTDPMASPERDMEAEREESERFEELGISVIRYDQVDERYSGLVRLLDRWAQLQPVPIRSGFGPESLP